MPGEPTAALHGTAATVGLVILLTVVGAALAFALWVQFGCPYPGKQRRKLKREREQPWLSR